jgi:hypothetical protein
MAQEIGDESLLFSRKAAKNAKTSKGSPQDVQDMVLTTKAPSHQGGAGFMGLTGKSQEIHYYC